jgi:hypothetical protein
MLHTEPHPLAGQTVTLSAKAQDARGRVIPGAEFRIEDWADRVFGKSWMDMNGHPASLVYAIRSAGYTPIDDEVVYGKINHIGDVVHVTELGEVTE